MLKSVVPPLPKPEHLPRLEKAIKKQNEALENVSSDLHDYFAKSFFAFAKSSSEELRPIYERFVNSGARFANSFSTFVKKIVPTINSIKDLEDKFSHTQKLFNQYQDDIKDVRNEETLENIEQEKEHLLKFVEEFQKTNTESNSLLPCFLVLYTASCTALSTDASEFCQEITEIVEGYKKLDTSKEEQELADTIKGLEAELQEYNEKKAAKSKPQDKAPEPENTKEEQPDNSQQEETKPETQNDKANSEEKIEEKTAQ